MPATPDLLGRGLDFGAVQDLADGVQRVSGRLELTQAFEPFQMRAVIMLPAANSQGGWQQLLLHVEANRPPSEPRGVCQFVDSKGLLHACIM